MQNLPARIAAHLAGLALLVAGLVSSPGLGADAAIGTVVHVSDGAVRGLAAGNHTSFLGIPYAAPPVGNLRWQAPQPAARWAGVRDATEPGQPCPQHGRPTQPTVVGSEDCLYLNVTAPVTARPGTKLPVMVWLHGGGFVTGSGADYDPARLVATGQVIVVTVNYRLGALGFLDLPELARQDPYAGNFALADQQASLRWVARNAAAFGGDPGNVTAFGQSGGAIAICAHLGAPGSRGLFQQAIIQSGPCGNRLITAETAEQRGTTVAAGLGCASYDGAAPVDVVACMRGKPASDLVGTGVSTDLTSSAWEYVSGTPALPEQPIDALRDGSSVPVPLIQGSTHDEMRQTVASQYDQRGTPLSAADYPAVLGSIFGETAPAVLAHYPLSNYPTPSLALATVLTDWGHAVGACQVLPADDAASRRAPVYAYEFAQDEGRRIGDFPLGATHGSDLPYLFDGTFTFAPPPPADPTLSAQMIDYWTQFARTGNPNPSNPGPAPYWPSYRNNGPVQSLSAMRIAQTNFATDHQCAFWNKTQS